MGGDLRLIYNRYDQPDDRARGYHADSLFVGGRLRNFRDYGREGLISFRRGYAYTVLVFFYAGVLFAIAMYLYLTFMDNGYLLSQMSKVLNSDEARQAMQQYGMTEMMNESMKQMAQIRPIDYALDMLTVNITLGFILGVPISLIMQRTMLKSNE